MLCPDEDTNDRDSVIEPQKEDTAEAHCFRGNCLRPEDPWSNMSALGKQSSQETMTKKTVHNTSGEIYCLDMDPSLHYMNGITNELTPVMQKTQTLTSLRAGHHHPLGFYGPRSLQLFKPDVPLFQPREWSVWPKDYPGASMRRGLSSMPRLKEQKSSRLSPERFSSQVKSYLPQRRATSQVISHTVPYQHNNPSV